MPLRNAEFNEAFAAQVIPSVLERLD